MKSKQKKKKVFSKEVAYILKELLKQPVEGASGTAKPCKISGMDVAAKTGTTNDNYDKWLCGFTTYYTAVTWYGYDTCETVSYRGKSPAVLLWSAVMKNVHSGLAGTTFQKPASIKQAEICPETGNIASSKCSDTYTEYFLSGTLPGNCVGCTGPGSKRTTTQNTNNTNYNTEPEEDNDDGDHSGSVEITNVPQTTQNTTKPTNTNNVVNENKTTQGSSNNTANQTTNNTTGQTNSTITNGSSNTTNQSQSTGKTNNSNKGNNYNSQNQAEDDEEDDGP